MALPSRVKIVEVSPRDGLQNEKEFVPTDVKVELIDRLAAAGFPNVEAASFVSPKWVPQMADGAEVMTRIARRPGTIYSVLTPNMKGFEGALAARADEIVIFGGASEAFSQKNINCSIAESIARFEPVAEAARAGIRVRGSISCALGCPGRGRAGSRGRCGAALPGHGRGRDRRGRHHRRGHAATRARGHGRGDAGGGSGPRVRPFPRHLRAGAGQYPGRAGNRHLDLPHLGGRPGRLPYAKGATGNVATEDVLYMLRGLDIDTGVDFDAVVDIGQWMAGHLNRIQPRRQRHRGQARRMSVNASAPTAEERAALLRDIGPLPCRARPGPTGSASCPG